MERQAVRRRVAARCVTTCATIRKNNARSQSLSNASLERSPWEEPRQLKQKLARSERDSPTGVLIATVLFPRGRRPSFKSGWWHGASPRLRSRRGPINLIKFDQTKRTNKHLTCGQACDRVELRGIGAFTVRMRRGRPGRNPRPVRMSPCHRGCIPILSRASQWAKG